MVPHIYLHPFIFVFLGITAEAEKILVLFTFPSKSHVGSYQPLCEELARRGHEITIVTPFPKHKNISNYNEIVIDDPFSKEDQDINTFDLQKIPYFIQMLFFRPFMLEACESTLGHPNIQKLIHSVNLKFDLIIYEMFFTDCIHGFLHKFKAPSIQVLPNTVVPWVADAVGNPNTLSYVPYILSSHEQMDFFSRFSAFVFDMYVKLYHRLLVVPQMDSIMRKYFTDPTLPTISELEKSASFLFLHSHPIFHHPRPLTPNTIELAGLHIKSNQELPKDLKKFLDEAPHGVIYFSLGSTARSADMPDDMRDAILKSFSKLKQRVLWKWEVDTLPGQPSNVRIGKWLPQNDVLAHPNVKLFITHGGLLSLQEAIYFGVPLISIPLSHDQMFNADVTKNRGAGVILNVNNVTEESLDWALNEVLYQPKYRESAKRLSSIFKDQPQRPLDRAVFWVEYAIRHKGAKHLRSAALDLNFFQYYLLDVIAVLLAGSILLVLALIYASKLVLRHVCSKSKRSSNKDVSDKKNK